MPLMVNPDTGALFAQPLGVHTTLNPGLGGALPVPQSTIAANIAAATNDVQTVASAEYAKQQSLSRYMPFLLLLACLGLWILCMILAYNRFLARVFASTEKISPSQSRAEKLGLVNGSAKGRKLGGGDLKTGWVLRKGDASVQLDDEYQYESEYKCESAIPSSANPFLSPEDESRPGSAMSIRSEKSIIGSTKRLASLFPPPHITPIWQNLPFAQSLYFTPFARWPSVFRSSITLARLYIIVSYLAFCGLVIVYKSDLSDRTENKGYGRDFARTGNLAIAQLPLAVALGVKGNMIGLAMGVGYERLKIFHKFVGRIVFLCSAVHALWFYYQWIKAGSFVKNISAPGMASATAGFFALILLVVSSLPWVRRSAHGLFKICHIVGMMGFIIGMAWHVPLCVPYCIAALILYAISLISSACKTRIAHAELLTLPGSDVTGIFIPTLRTGWRPGQHVRIRVPALGLRIGWESHPFTISSAPNGDGLVLLCKRAGDWTNALADLAESGASTDDDEGNQTTVTVILEGPYGGHGNTMMASFSGLMLTAGGSGISHALSIAHDVLNSASSGVVRARTIDLIWVVKTESAARAVLPTLLELVNEAKAHETFCIEGRRKGRNVPNPTALRVHIFVTRCPLSSPLTLLSNPFADPDDEAYAAAGPGVLFDRSASRVKQLQLSRENSGRSVRSNSNGNSPGTPGTPGTMGAPSPISPYGPSGNLLSPSADGVIAGIAGQRPNLKRQRTDAEKVMHGYLARNASSNTTSTVSTASSIKHAKRWVPLSSIAAHPGRPDWSNLVDALADETLRRGIKEKVDPSGLCVTSCGPHELVDGVRDAVRRLEGWKRRQVGGVDFEEEHFGF